MKWRDRMHYWFVTGQGHARLKEAALAVKPRVEREYLKAIPFHPPSPVMLELLELTDRAHHQRSISAGYGPLMVHSARPKTTKAPFGALTGTR